MSDPSSASAASQAITKVAILGKGGSGKTVLASLLVRAIAERGWLVLAVDLDANPGLALSLGVVPHDLALPDSAIEARPDVPYGWGLARHVTAAEAVRRYAFRAGDKVAFLGFGNMSGVDTPLHRYLTAARQIAVGFEEPGWVVVVDLAAGPTNAFEGYARLATLALLTVNPTPTSILTGRRLSQILARDDTPFGVVAMGVSSPQDVDQVAQWMEPMAVIPFDAEVARLSRSGPLTSLSTESSALNAVRGLVTRLGL